MTIEQDFHLAMLTVYEQAGRECGYWAKRYLAAVKRHGGLEYAHQALRPLKNDAVQSGLQALIDAGRPEISVEAVALRPEFRHLFTTTELKEAERRLSNLPDYVHRRRVAPDLVFPDSLQPELNHVEGAIRRIIVNAYERDPNARAACLKKYGYNCVVCSVNFEQRYGEIGAAFIHVHHKKPLATMRGEYRVDPTKDLVPVCPNCHAMLHTSEPPLSVVELKRIYESHGGKA